MSISRRGAMLGASAAVAVAGVPTAVAAQADDPLLAGEERQLLTVFRKLSDDRRALAHDTMRMFAGLPSDPQLKRRWFSEPAGEARS